MKTIKPGKVEHDDRVEETSQSIPSPQRVEEDQLLQEVEKEEKARLTSLKSIGNAARKTLIVGSLLASLIVIGTIYDAAFTASSMLSTMPLLGVLYLGILFALVAILGISAVKQYLGYAKLKRIEMLQVEGLDLLKNPARGAKQYAQKIILKYLDHENKEIKEAAQKLQKELPSMLESEVLERLDEVLLNRLDAKAKSIITNYASQTAVSTAISPVALIDAILIISRSYAMIGEISNLYGYKPNFLGEIALIKNVFINLAFASVTELLTHHSGDMFGSTMLSKVSMHSAQGVANGVLTARVGLGTIKSVRPLIYKDKNEGFLKNITKTIIDKIFSTK